MNKKPNIDNLISLIGKWKINKTMLAEAISMNRGTFEKKISPNIPGYNFTAWELFTIATNLDVMADELHSLFKAETKLYFKNSDSLKFQNSLKKSEGVVLGKKKEFAGGTMIATGKNNPDAFRPFKTDHVVIDCDESGNPVTI